MCCMFVLIRCTSTITCICTCASTPFLLNRYIQGRLSVGVNRAGAVCAIQKGGSGGLEPSLVFEMIKVTICLFLSEFLCVCALFCACARM